MGFIADLFGNKATDNVLDKIDSIIDNLPLKPPVQHYDSMVNGALKDIVNTNGENEKDVKFAKTNVDEIEQMLQGITVPENRLRRYDTYDDIYKSIQLVKRVLKVYINNIFQKDPVTNTMILIKESEKNKNYEKLDTIKKMVRDILTFYKLEEKLKYTVAFNLLKYGDSFLEIIDLDDIEVKFPVVTNSSRDEGIITETYNQLNSKNQYRNDIVLDNMEEFLECLVDFDTPLQIDESLLPIQENSFDEESADVAKYNLKRILLNYHRFHKIIPLISPYDNILGYVEIKESEKSATSVNILKQFTDIIDKIGSKTPNSTEKYDEVIKKFSDLIVKKVLVKYKVTKKDNDTNEEYAEAIQKTLDPDLYYSLKRVLIASQENSLFRKKLRIRFIRPDNMLWFRTSGSDFYPFGTSVIDPLVFPGKLFMFTNLANTVYKLSKASQVRKWIVETGFLFGSV